jgi:hypothetical protein
VAVLQELMITTSGLGWLKQEKKCSFYVQKWLGFSPTD